MNRCISIILFSVVLVGFRPVQAKWVQAPYSSKFMSFAGFDFASKDNLWAITEKSSSGAVGTDVYLSKWSPKNKKWKEFVKVIKRGRANIVSDMIISAAPDGSVFVLMPRKWSSGVAQSFKRAAEIYKVELRKVLKNIDKKLLALFNAFADENNTFRKLSRFLPSSKEFKRLDAKAKKSIRDAEIRVGLALRRMLVSLRNTWSRAILRFFKGKLINLGEIRVADPGRPTGSKAVSRKILGIAASGKNELYCLNARDTSKRQKIVHNWVERWNGSSWVRYGKDVNGARKISVGVDGSVYVLVSGSKRGKGKKSEKKNFVFKWDGSSWRAIAAAPVQSVDSMSVISDRDIWFSVKGCNFYHWNGNKLEPKGSAKDSSVAGRCSSHIAVAPGIVLVRLNNGNLYRWLGK